MPHLRPVRHCPPVRRLTLLLTLLALCCCDRAPPARTLSVAAAMSLRQVMPELVHAYEAQHPGTRVSVTYGASGDLKTQVEAGAPLDAVLFAGARPLDELVAEARVDGASRRVVASNQLVLVAKAGSAPLTFATLTKLPAGELLAAGDPRTVPAGEYAKDYLMALGEWDALQPRLVLGSSVAAVLVYARRGEVAAAIIYRTELRGAPDLRVLDAAEGPLAPHATVVAGVVHGGSADAAPFLDLVASSEGARILASFGFGPP